MHRATQSWQLCVFCDPREVALHSKCMRKIALPITFLLASCGGDDGPCNPLAQTGCDDGQTCEQVADGKPTCFASVAVKGRVFDLGDPTKGIEGALIVALDVNGSAISNVVKSGADGAYTLPIPTDRDADGNPLVFATLTLHTDAVGYESFPGTVRQPLPIDLSTATIDGDGLTVKSALTDIGMLPLAGSGGAGVIHGKAEVPADNAGIIVVAESNGAGHPVVAARDGSYTILNLPDGDYTVQAYSWNQNYTAGAATVAQNDVTVDLKLTHEAGTTISGNVTIVDPGGATGTSVILFIDSTFDTLTGRGITVPGLRAPGNGPPTITGAWTMEGVPAGKYVVVAGFENDGLVRDPDHCIAGTADVHIDVATGTPLVIDQSFKVTGALAVSAPGATAAELVQSNPLFAWVDDASEDQYLVEVFDSYGQRIWMKTMAGVSGGTPTMAYDGNPALVSGGYYQFRVTSTAQNGPNSQRCELSRTEDLKGVFYLP